MTRGKEQLSLVLAAEGGDRPAAEELSQYEDFPSEDGEGGMAEENGMLEEGYYELEAIRRKRMRKGVAQYLIKWRSYPESDNTWEPLENLQSCSNEVDLFEESLKTGEKSSCKRRRKGATSPSSSMKKREKTCSPAAATPSGKALDIRLVTSSLVEESLRVADRAVVAEEKNDLHPATNGDKVRSQVPDRCTGAKRRKSGMVKRFIPEAGSSTIDGAQDVSAMNAFCGMATNQVIQNGSSGTSKTLHDSCHITEILKMESFISFTINNTKDDWVTFTAKRANGSEVTVDNKFLKATHFDLLLNFYEKHFYEIQSS